MEEIQKRVIELTKQNQESGRRVWNSAFPYRGGYEAVFTGVINEVQKYKTTTNKTNNGDT
ncbi:MAG: hypothetical protein M3Y53_07700, partial [Thermoproteota archaeon]|nr:hypothetical protein [Thermoproteota archaeon]